MGTKQNTTSCWNHSQTLGSQVPSQAKVGSFLSSFGSYPVSANVHASNLRCLVSVSIVAGEMLSLEIAPILGTLLLPPEVMLHVANQILVVL